MVKNFDVPDLAEIVLKKAHDLGDMQQVLFFLKSYLWPSCKK